MPNRSVTPPSHVRSAYEGVLAALEDAASSANCSIPYSSHPISSRFFEIDRDRAEFKMVTWLKGWPCRHLKNSERLDIIISAFETFQRTSWSILKSTVNAYYLIISNSRAPLFQSLHYDYNSGEQGHHAFFHVQLSDKPIPEDQLQEIRSHGFDVELPAPDDARKSCVKTGIPTPDMTLASVLYCLVADHLKNPIFCDFAKRIDSIQDRLPLLDCETLKESLKNSKHLKSFHWFAHLREHN